MELSFFQDVEKPSRYLGGELNSIIKDWDNTVLKIALSYPDLYEIGLSHMGIPILYHYINSLEGILAERVFSPAKDLESKLRKNNIPLFSLENKKPIKNFDILGFSLLSELDYTNLLNILELSQIPLFSNERGEDNPIVFAGGVNVFNPEPIAPFIDVFYIGDAEANFFNILKKIKIKKQEGVKREDILKSLLNEKGVYIPKYYDRKKDGKFLIPYNKDKRLIIKKGYVKNLDKYPLPDKPLVPNTEIVFDRLSVEIARGCPQKCRFCQATFVYHPFRWRNPDYLIDYIIKTSQATGFEDFSLSSLSTADYPFLEKVMISIYNHLKNKRIAIGLPSLRPTKIKEIMLEIIKKVRKTGFTIVPEAGTERLRKVINKYVTDEEIFNSLKLAYSYGWRTIKFYFMIGLPTETIEDIDGIIDILIRTSNLGRKYKRKLRISSTISTFIPKPHTPFQWCGFSNEEEIKEKKNYILEKIKSRREIFLKFHSYKTAYLESLLSRGDIRVSDIIYRAFKLGARFDAWDNELNFNIWEKAIKESGIDPNIFLEKIDINTPLHFQVIDTGIKNSFLLEEFSRSKKALRTQSCVERDCAECKGCIFPVKSILKNQINDIQIPKIETADNTKEGKIYRYLIFYSKIFPVNFLSGIEISRVIERIIRRSSLEFEFTQGYHPKIKISFLYSDPLGAFLEEDVFEIRSKHLFKENLLKELNKVSLKGLSFNKVILLPDNSKKFSKLTKAVVFKIDKKYLKDEFEKIINISGIKEFDRFNLKDNDYYFYFNYDPTITFNPYKLFKLIMKEYIPSHITKARVFLKGDLS
jgi:radical SAM family uncharacterized protein